MMAIEGVAIDVEFVRIGIVTVPVNVGDAVITTVPPVPLWAVIAVPLLMAMEGVAILVVFVRIGIVTVPVNVGDAATTLTPPVPV